MIHAKYSVHVADSNHFESIHILNPKTTDIVKLKKFILNSLIKTKCTTGVINPYANFPCTWNIKALKINKQPEREKKNGKKSLILRDSRPWKNIGTAETVRESPRDIRASGAAKYASGRKKTRYTHTQAHNEERRRRAADRGVESGGESGEENREGADKNSPPLVRPHPGLVYSSFSAPACLHCV